MDFYPKFQTKNYTELVIILWSYPRITGCKSWQSFTASFHGNKYSIKLKKISQGASRKEKFTELVILLVGLL